MPLQGLVCWVGRVPRPLARADELEPFELEVARLELQARRSLS